MLLIASGLREISFEQLMKVYFESNQKNGAIIAPFDTPERQLRLAEDDFYEYLHDAFFPLPGACYAIWQDGGVYRSALRFEPYLDGILLEALETAPQERRKGYAECLIRGVQAYIFAKGHAVIYSHVSRKNAASLAVHKKCGFQIFSEYAAYIDGSVDSAAYTMRSSNFTKSDSDIAHF